MDSSFLLKLQDYLKQKTQPIVNKVDDIIQSPDTQELINSSYGQLATKGKQLLQAPVKMISDNLFYNPETKKVLPQAMWNDLPNPLTASVGDMQGAALPLAMGMTGEVTQKTPTIGLKDILKSEDLGIIDTFLDSVKAGKGKGVLGQIGKDVQNIVEQPLVYRTLKKLMRGDPATASSTQLATGLEKLVNSVDRPTSNLAVGLSKVDDAAKLDPLATEAQKLEQRAIKLHGTTNVDESVGFITKDGKAISSSGKLQGSPSEGRNVDHRQIALDALPDSSKGTEGGDALIGFMNETKSVRVVSAGKNGLNIDVVGYPTEQQFSKLKDLARRSDGIYADISKVDGSTAKSGKFKTFNEYEKFVKDYFGVKDKYPEKVYKAINDAWGTKMTKKEVDDLGFDELRNNASQALEGGRDEFDKLVNPTQAKGGVGK